MPLNSTFHSDPVFSSFWKTPSGLVRHFGLSWRPDWLSPPAITRKSAPSICHSLPSYAPGGGYADLAGRSTKSSRSFLHLWFLCHTASVERLCVVEPNHMQSQSQNCWNAGGPSPTSLLVALPPSSYQSDPSKIAIQQVDPVRAYTRFWNLRSDGGGYKTEPVPSPVYCSWSLRQLCLWDYSALNNSQHFWPMWCDIVSSGTKWYEPGKVWLHHARHVPTIHKRDLGCVVIWGGA